MINNKKISKWHNLLQDDKCGKVKKKRVNEIKNSCNFRVGRECLYDRRPLITNLKKVKEYTLWTSS